MFNKKYFLYTFLLIALPSVFFMVRSAWKVRADQNFDVEKKQIEIVDGGLKFKVLSSANNVDNLLDEQKIVLSFHDIVLPEKSEKIYSGSQVIISRAKKITVKEGGKNVEFYTIQDTIEKAIWENKNIKFDEDDFTVPARNVPVKDGENIVITHVIIKEEIKNEPIAYKTISNEDDSLGWRIKKITQAGIKGNAEIKYKVVEHDGREISRKILEKNITQKPTDEIITQGTLVKTGKSYSGAASWYAFRGGLFAANPWLPMGSYVKVTNQDNGKSVVVKINDRGPFGNGRIIDLDKVAFSQIASIGAGVANVKMEVVLN